MGFFWADAPKPLPAVVTTSSSAPPPSCPMHKPSEPNASPYPPRQDSPQSIPSSCPVSGNSNALLKPNQPQPSSSVSESSKAQHAPSISSTLSKLNPLNYMPSLSNARPSDSPQSINLPLDRETSSIPRADNNTNWEYPSPQQMYNAMLRKGYTDTPAEDVESMVAVHNFLNEGAWREIEEWERIFSPGLAHAWAICSRGEQAIALERAKHDFLAARRQALDLPSSGDDEQYQPKLVRFQGRPNEPTPKARMLGIMGKLMSEKFGGEPPFDRHDWYVARKSPNGSVTEVRYVIDYYGGGVQATGEPVFYLDIRPALDTPTAAVERAMRWGGDIWHRASGGSAREAAGNNDRSGS
ncbi:holocytochrome c synthase [Exophiala xenobiotica]|nr:holocytochrome c synthase [Exophiala xenobiotica]KAK5343717.1 holocytochrome c synthase [Exophiala xenobiotica]KAK5559357.1 holocytochrome c synthase [Exophiala xenobiotica]